MYISVDKKRRTKELKPKEIIVESRGIITLQEIIIFFHHTAITVYYN